MSRETRRRSPPVLVLAVVLVLVLAACGGGSKRKASGPTTAPGGRPAGTSAGVGGCVGVEQPKPAQRSAPKPAARLDATKAYAVTVRTNCGSFTIALAVKTSPATTASFVSLARRGFFDRTIFHRIVPGFVVQGGDPTASGLGGPGYTTLDRPPPATRYTVGVVAMAKAASEPPGTSGSQFFVVTAQDAGLPPDYAVLGRVTKGLDVVRRIGELGDPATEQPTRVVEIEKATVTES